ncbi:hypothetical protein L249_5299 [Ophiocordyceps polyrhachis-furcata BCC 54312]|uniref:Pre-mRNA processing factor 4 (PRP4)-like domain-containing protein n=1 Tax=Ophiocordyceps polyrhachis-furcata BCC 54312 TaxID=1330021 RepID=A0A367L9Q7_9HYPO|nr:hypothetical protein L249_5299 [Ophiocordyceps polyrhachis-furcata BCC 54312]
MHHRIQAGSGFVKASGTATITIMYMVVVPAIFGYVGYKTDVGHGTVDDASLRSGYNASVLLPKASHLSLIHHRLAPLLGDISGSVSPRLHSPLGTPPPLLALDAGATDPSERGGKMAQDTKSPTTNRAAARSSQLRCLCSWSAVADYNTAEVLDRIARQRIAERCRAAKVRVDELEDQPSADGGVWKRGRLQRRELHSELAQCTAGPSLKSAFRQLNKPVRARAREDGGDCPQIGETLVKRDFDQSIEDLISSSMTAHVRDSRHHPLYIHLQRHKKEAENKTHYTQKGVIKAIMDFAAMMSKELKKVKPNESDKKYLKRSDMEAKRAAAYEAEQKAIEAEREAKAAAKRKREEEQAAETAEREEKRRKLAEASRLRRQELELEEERARRKRLGLPELKDTNGNGDEDAQNGEADAVGEEKLVKGLRALGQPVRLFGESQAARLRRYRKHTTVMTDGPIPTTLQLVDGPQMKVDGAVPKDVEGCKWLFRQLASYFTMVLVEYERAVEGEKRDTTASKTAYSAMVQTRENMKPLFRKFETGNIDNSLLEPIVEIVLQERTRHARMAPSLQGAGADTNELVSFLTR